jgi:hypothetical protein
MGAAQAVVIVACHTVAAAGPNLALWLLLLLLLSTVTVQALPFPMHTGSNL